MTASIGDVLAGKYRVDKILGIGGMGMVVAATHLELDTKVALKFMLPEALLSPQATDRFLREARAAVKLRGEHVCRVLDVGKLDTGSPYIVMEFLEGEDFAHVLARRGALPVAEATDYILQALEGLAEAHVNGIVHRDLKPGNLFVAVDNDGSALVKVLDFGISKSAGANATKTGEVMGSPAYMAPEQMVSAKDVDGRADLWAMGVIIYHAVAGRVPFEHDNLPALCMAVMNETPKPVDAISPNPIPPAFAATVMRCLSKQCEGRPADVGELAAALAPFGSVESQASANRIAKVLRRQGSSSGSSSAIAVTLPSSSSDLAAIVRQPTPVPETRHPISTIGASAGESMRQLPEAPARAKPLWPKLAAAGTIAALLVLVIVMATRGGSTTAPTTQPPPDTKPGIETKPEAKPPVVETTPEAKPPVVEAKPEAKPPVAETKPEAKQTVIATKPVVETKPTIKLEIKKPEIKKPEIKTAPKPGSGSATAVVETPKPPTGSGSATPGAGSDFKGYKGLEGQISTEYKKPKPATPPAPTPAPK